VWDLELEKMSEDGEESSDSLHRDGTNFGAQRRNALWETFDHHGAAA
jgi:hypothetical protein